MFPAVPIYINLICIPLNRRRRRRDSKGISRRIPSALQVGVFIIVLELWWDIRMAPQLIVEEFAGGAGQRVVPVGCLLRPNILNYVRRQH